MTSVSPSSDLLIELESCLLNEEASVLLVNITTVCFIIPDKGH